MKEVVEVADAHQLPVLVDNSNHLPPKENLWRYIEDGAALVAFSGGKGLQGPQGSGILAGRADLMEAVAMQASPTQGIGRVCKVSKEEVVAQVAALIWWAEQDDEARLAEHHRKTQKLVDLAQGLTGASAEPELPGPHWAAVRLDVPHRAAGERPHNGWRDRGSCTLANRR